MYAYAYWLLNEVIPTLKYAWPRICRGIKREKGQSYDQQDVEV